MSRRAWSVPALALVFGVAGCFQDQTTESGTSPGDGTGATMGASDATGSTGVVDGSDEDPTADSVGTECPTGFSCAAAVPEGWSGPLARFLGTDASLPSCGGDFPYLELEATSGLVAPAAQCEACTCGEPDDVECEGPELRMFTSNACNGSPALTFELGEHDECISFGEYAVDVDGMESDVVVPVAGTGACEASGGSAILDEPVWTNHLRGCGGAPEEGACGDAGTCVPTPGNPFAAGLCIMAEGDLPCPPGDYALRNVYYQGFDDARDCSACECESAQGVECQSLIEVHYNANCGNLRASIDTPAAGACYDIDGSNYAPRSGRMIVYDTAGGSCAAAGGEPTGEAQPSGVTTICCMQ